MFALLPEDYAKKHIITARSNEIMTTGDYLGLLIQVPLVGVFIWFALRLVSMFLDSLEKRDLQWQNFLKEQREATNTSMSNLAARLGDEMKEISKEVSELRGRIRE